MTTTLMLCDCGGSQSLDREALAAATGMACSRVHTGLCTHQIGAVAEALQVGGAEVIVACQQEAETFAELADEVGAEAPLCVDLRDRAGWSDEAGAATPKMAALLAAAVMPRPPVKTIDVASEGVCLILGASATVLPVAEQLAETLAVTCLLSDVPETEPRPTRRFDIALGRLRSATGAFGGFSIRVDGFRAADPAGRGALRFGASRDGAESDCDIILDLRRGEAPQFPAHEKREGYLRADPGDPVAVQRAAWEASQLVGTFEKPLHVALDESLCAHSRASQTGCTRCLTVCPTGAIAPKGDVVSIDVNICAGCGACSAVCPSGAVGLEDPPVSWIMTTVRTLASAYLSAGGAAPRLLVHDGKTGREMIGLAARYGTGLPAAVIPMELGSLAAFGHAEALVALASGFAAVDVLLSPRSDRETLESEVALAGALLSGLGIEADRVGLLDIADPEALSGVLRARRATALRSAPVLPLGARRDAVRLAMKALADGAAVDPIPLPVGAPYGAVLVDQEACTLCLSCAGLCPPGALGDNPDCPELRFQEDACLQCGLCAQVCPENAITLKPRLDLSDAALSQRVLKEEEPYPCIECGTLFGVKSTIERIVAKLESHTMFVNSDNTRLIRMCDDCRVRAQYHGDSAPFQVGQRPKVRTTEDYLDERKKH